MIKFTCDSCGKEAQPKEIRLSLLTECIVDVSMSSPEFQNLCQEAVKSIVSRFNLNQEQHIKMAPILPEGWASTFECSKFWVACFKDCMHKLSVVFDSFNNQEFN